MSASLAAGSRFRHKFSSSQSLIKRPRQVESNQGRKESQRKTRCRAVPATRARDSAEWIRKGNGEKNSSKPD